MRAELETILRSAAFAGSPQLRAFLTYIVEQKLQGNENRIKGYTIAVEALGRDPSFDPAADPIVRVEAARLRRLLDDFYAGEGDGERVRIAVPKGGYVPRFSVAEEDTAGASASPPSAIPMPQPAPGASGSTDDGLPAPEEAPAPRRRVGRALFAVAGTTFALAGLAVLVAFLVLPPDYFTLPAKDAARVAAGPAASDALPLFKGELPSVFVAPIATEGDAGSGAKFSTAAVHDNLEQALSLFPEITVGKAEDAADYRIEGRASFTDEKVFLSFMLVYLGDQEIVWSSLFDLTYDRNAADFAEERIVRSIAGAIARPYGVIFSHAASRGGGTDAVPEEYRCVLLTYNSQRRFAPDVNARGRDCLTTLAGRPASFAPAQALLPMLYVDNARFGPGSDREREAALAQALVLARHAVAAAPESARAYQALQAVLLHTGKAEEALDAGRKARQLNPYDTDIMAAHGSALIMLDEAEEGLRLLREARRQSPGHPAWYDTMIVFGAFEAGNRKQALKEASEIGRDETLSGLLARLLVARARSDGGKSPQGEPPEELLKQIAALHPAFAEEPKAALERIFPSSRLRSQLLDALRVAGLSTAE